MKGMLWMDWDSIDLTFGCGWKVWPRVTRRFRKVSDGPDGDAVTKEGDGRDNLGFEMRVDGADGSG